MNPFSFELGEKVRVDSDCIHHANQSGEIRALELRMTTSGPRTFASVKTYNGLIVVAESQLGRA